MMKLVIHDTCSAAGLLVSGVSHAHEIVRILRGLEETGNASVLLEAFAQRCLELGIDFDSTDPLTACTVCSTLVEVEVHEDPGMPAAHFVRLYHRDASGILCRLHHGTLHAVARQLRCEDGPMIPVTPAIPVSVRHGLQ